MSHPKFADANYPILDVLTRRWSPYVFDSKAVDEADVCALFEAARWAPSSYNEQPWRYILALKSNSEHFERVLSCLFEANQAWAAAAPVLAIGCYQDSISRNGKPNGCAPHDLGLAAGNLTTEATARGLAVHQMAGIFPDRVKELFGLPAGVVPLTGLAIGYAVAPQNVPENMKDRDLTPRQRKPLAEFVFGDKWGEAAEVVSRK